MNLYTHSLSKGLLKPEIAGLEHGNVSEERGFVSIRTLLEKDTAFQAPVLNGANNTVERDVADVTMGKRQS